MSIDNPSDTILFAMNGMESGNITLPAMKGMQTIPSFTISGAKFTLGENHVVTFADQTFSTKVTVNRQLALAYCCVPVRQHADAYDLQREGLPRKGGV